MVNTKGMVKRMVRKEDRLQTAWIVLATTCFALTGCAVGPDYHRPSMDLPDHFKEGVDWQRAQPGTSAALRDDWWLSYQDQELNQIIQQALKANQSIAAAEAAYRVSQAVVHGASAAMYPTVGANLGATRSGYGPNVPLVAGGTGKAATYNLVSVGATVSWEPDLWGAVSRGVEAAKASEEANDAQLAGVRLSIAASVASDYFALRQADADIVSTQSQRDVDEKILHMVEASRENGLTSNDEVLAARNAVDSDVTALETLQTVREQTEHAIAVLLGLPPASFSLPARPVYVFNVPQIPLLLPSELLLRRYDVVNAERTAAAANARIGVAKAAFFPELNLSAQGGFDNSSAAQLLSASSRVWTLGPSLALTLFDGGARDAAVESARATYDGDAAIYRNTVITAFQSVEDSLSSMHHLDMQVLAQSRILKNSEQLFANAQQQRQIGSGSEQDLLSAQLALLAAQRNFTDARAASCQSSVMLIKNLGGGWQWKTSEQPQNSPPAAIQSRSSQ